MKINVALSACRSSITLLQSPHSMTVVFTPTACGVDALGTYARKVYDAVNNDKLGQCPRSKVNALKAIADQCQGIDEFVSRVLAL